MNTKTTTPILIFYTLLITLLCSLTISHTYADDSDDQNRYGYMGYGQMGPGYMGSGHMGYGRMGSGYMGSGHMGYGRMGTGHMGMGMGMGMMGINYMHMLDLSDSQRKSMRSIQKSTRTQQFALHDKLTEYADELYSLYKKEKPNAKKIGGVYKKIFDIKRQKIELGITTKNKAYDVLTEEQKEKLKEWKSSGMGYRQYRGRQGRGMHRMME